MYDLPSWKELRRAVHSKMLQSRIVNLIGLSGSGRTSLLALIVSDWRSAGFAAIVIDDTLTPEAFRIKAQEQLTATAPWLVAVDDFDTLLNGPSGGRWNDVLNGYCVNIKFGEKPPAVILVSDSRFSLLDLARRSLIADAITDTVAPPQISADDLVAVGWKSSNVARQALGQYGSFPRLLRESRAGSVPAGVADAILLSVVPGVTGALAQRLRQLTRRDGVKSQPHVIDDQLSPLLSRDGAQVVCAAHFVRAGYAQLIEGASQFWPRSLRDSARRFASRLFLSKEAIWLDRYIGSTPRQLLKFLDLVAAVRGEFKLRILSEPSSVNAIAGVDKQFVRTEFARLAADGFEVRWRALHPNDVRTVHARQLIFPNVPGIYHLPPVDRLLDTAAVGNEVDAFISKFGDWEAGERLWSQSSNWL